MWNEKLKKLEGEKNLKIEELRHENKQLKVQMEKEGSDKSVENLLDIETTVEQNF